MPNTPDKKSGRTNIYAEMLSTLPVPERLSPANIAAMLEANSGAAVRRSGIAVSPASSEIKADPRANLKDNPMANPKANPMDNPMDNPETKPRFGKLILIYRSVAAVAACAVLGLGVVRYVGLGTATSVGSDVKGSAYADNYDELHKTFTKYYVDDSGKKTLDSALAEIEHSYTDSQTNSVSDKPADIGTQPQPGADIPPKDTAPADTPAAPDDGNVPNNNGVRLPVMSGESEPDNVLIAGSRIYVRDGSRIKVLFTSHGQMEYIGDAVPEAGIFETKTLEKMFAVGERLVAVYSVINEEPVSIPASEESGSVVGELVNGIYSDDTETVKTLSVEIVIYESDAGFGVMPVQVISQNGTLVDVKESGGYVYAVANYNDYRHSPINGVDDLDNYVPSYTINGIKSYIRPENILIPGYVSTTDYTVITGVAAADEGMPVLVQAVLGSEGKAIVTDKSVYVFGYSDVDGAQKTVCERLSLSFGSAKFVGSISVEGIAVSGGICQRDGSVLITALTNTESGYITRVSALVDDADNGMALASQLDFPGALSHVSFDGGKVYLSNATDGYAADFTNPVIPLQIEYSDDIDLTSGLVKFGDGYVTLTEEDGAIRLEKIKAAEDGGFTLESGIDIDCDGREAGSKAINDNSILYIDDVNGYVGVPYGFFDGFDYCYRYELFRLGSDGFKSVGSIESHEVDEAFETARAKLAGGILYVISDGRIYSTAVGQESFTQIDSVDLIESSYSCSGHEQ